MNFVVKPYQFEISMLFCCCYNYTAAAVLLFQKQFNWELHFGRIAIELKLVKQSNSAKAIVEQMSEA